MSLRNQHPDSKEYRKQTDWNFKIRPVLKHKFQRLFLYEPCTSTAPPFLPRGKNTQSHLWFQIENVPAQDINDNDEYISKAPNPSISDPHEAQSAVGVQLKPSKQRNQRHQEEVGDGRVKGQGPSIKYTTNYTLHNSLSHPVSLSFSLFLFPLPPSLHFSSRHSLSLPLRFTDRSARQTTAVHEKKTKQKKSLPGDQGSSEKAEVKRKVLREVLNCERKLLSHKTTDFQAQMNSMQVEIQLFLIHRTYLFSKRFFKGRRGGGVLSSFLILSLSLNSPSVFNGQRLWPMTCE